MGGMGRNLHTAQIGQNQGKWRSFVTWFKLPLETFDTIMMHHKNLEARV